MVYTIVQGDYGYNLNFSMTENSLPLNLTGASVAFKMRSVASAGNQVDKHITVSSASAGTVTYKLGTADTKVAGTFDWELEATYSSAIKTTKGDAQIIIRPQL